MKKRLQAIWRAFLETLFPAVCLGCRAEGSFLCDACFGNIERMEGRGFEKVGGCAALDGVMACCVYREGSLLARLIHAFKYGFVKDLSLPLGRLMREALEAAPVPGAALCAVPLHRKRMRWRGFNQAELLARAISEGEVRAVLAAGPGQSLAVAQLLKRVHFKKPQMELARAERIENVRGAFALVENAAGPGDQKIPHTVILVDDVATTLSTLESCATVLKRAGVQKVYGIVLARVY